MVEFGICPECGDTTTHRYRPFCSKRCADLDLSSWLQGYYRIATNEDTDFTEFPGLPENEEY